MHTFVSPGFTVYIFSEMVLYTKCARIDYFQWVGLSFERKADSPICCERWQLGKTERRLGNDCPAFTPQPPLAPARMPFTIGARMCSAVLGRSLII